MKKCFASLTYSLPNEDYGFPAGIQSIGCGYSPLRTRRPALDLDSRGSAGHEWNRHTSLASCHGGGGGAEHYASGCAAPMSQPNLTKQIQELEEYLGFTLFVRNNQGVKPTEACLIFLEEADLSLSHLERAIHRSRSAAQGEEAILNFGSSPYSDPYLVSTILSVRLPHYPTLRVIVSSAFSEELSRQVITGQLDVALVASGIPDSRLNCLQVAAHPFYVVLRDQDALAGKKTVSLKDFDKRVWILFGRQVHPTLYDQMTTRANETGAQTQGDSSCYLRGTGGLFSAGSSRRRILDARRRMADCTERYDDAAACRGRLRSEDSPVTRARDESRLTSQFVRSAMTKLEGEPGVNHHRLRLAG